MGNAITAALSNYIADKSGATYAPFNYALAQTTQSDAVISVQLSNFDGDGQQFPVGDRRVSSSCCPFQLHLTKTTTYLHIVVHRVQTFTKQSKLARIPSCHFPHFLYITILFTKLLTNWIVSPRFFCFFFPPSIFAVCLSFSFRFWQLLLYQQNSRVKFALKR